MRQIKKDHVHSSIGIGLMLLLCNFSSYAFESGSTGSDGVFDPLVDTEIQLTTDGVFNYQSVNIRQGVVVTFSSNDSNNPVIWLVQGDVTVDGVIDLSAIGRLAGPGGFDGGAGGLAPHGAGGAGQGPGGGSPGFGNPGITTGCPGGGGSYSTRGKGLSGSCNVPSGETYGREELIPLLGGSGGGGGGGTNVSTGGEGSGGGGAILIAASGSVTINGELKANSGAVALNTGTCGSEGSGGAIRIVASTISGEGTIQAISDPGDCPSAFGPPFGGVGYIRIETESLQRTASSSPPFTIDLPGPLFVPNFPRLSISSIAGIGVPANPTGLNDVELPVNTSNPITIELGAQEIPLGLEVILKVLPTRGLPSTDTSSPLSGTLGSSTATVSIDLPDGSSTLIASVEFVVDAQASRDYAPYAGGQLVARIRTSYDADKGPITTFITQDGDEFPWPSNAIGIN